MVQLPNKWSEILRQETQKPYFHNLGVFLNAEYNEKKIWPLKENIFKAYELCKPEDVKVVIIGQDPYPNAHAHGLSFSTTQQRRPVSLNYIFKEICDNYPEYDIQKDFPTNNLTNWAKQGVFLLNSVLTVQEGISNSHEGKGWEQFTQATIRALIDDSNPRVFMLWGRDAQRAFTRATATPIPRIISRQAVLECGHPAAAAYGKNLFSGNRHFVQANEYLLHHKKSIISWKTGL